jgi:5-methyltetrahydrofolate--homocysteine methyltransferase
VHVLDASRAVGVVGALLDKDKRAEFVDDVRDEYRDVREERAGRRERSQLLAIAEARARAGRVDGTDPTPAPARPGVHTFEVPPSDLRPYIDWTPFFQAWELHGKYPSILEDELVGSEARKLLADAEAMLDRIESEALVQPRAVVGLFPAAAAGDDVKLFTDDSRADVRAVVHGLRQQFDKGGRENLCLSDFVQPAETGVPDWMGAFAVTVHGAEDLAQGLEAENDDYNAILMKSLADRLAEALAEYTHEKVRTEIWGYAPNESLDNASLIAESYQGIRPAPGYPACPDHTEKRTLLELLDAEARIGIQLTESCAMTPASSVSGWYFAHKTAKYFGVGRVGRDQVEDYAARKGWTVEEAEGWLAPNLGYDPDEPGS